MWPTFVLLIAESSVPIDVIALNENRRAVPCACMNCACSSMPTSADLSADHSHGHASANIVTNQSPDAALVFTKMIINNSQCCLSITSLALSVLS